MHMLINRFLVLVATWMFFGDSLLIAQDTPRTKSQVEAAKNIVPNVTESISLVEFIRKNPQSNIVWERTRNWI